MLKNLSISEYVIISTLSVNFDAGLTVLTGETGAGKSILLDALGLILGDAPDPDSIRQGAEKSIIEALFDQPEAHPVWKFLAARADMAQIPPPLLRIKRTISRAGKDEIAVNDVLVDLDFLKILGTYLGEIHGQNANQTFLAPENQLALLDAFGAFPEEIIGNVSKAWDHIGIITQELEEEKNFFARAEREKQNIDRVVSQE
jgi:DNA repair protein RecN (Recombination protein N)